MTHMGALGEAPWYGPVVAIDKSSGWTSHIQMDEKLSE